MLLDYDGYKQQEDDYIKYDLLEVVSSLIEYTHLEYNSIRFLMQLLRDILL